MRRNHYGYSRVQVAVARKGGEAGRVGGRRAGCTSRNVLNAYEAPAQRSNGEI